MLLTEVIKIEFSKLEVSKKRSDQHKLYNEIIYILISTVTNGKSLFTVISVSDIVDGGEFTLLLIRRLVGPLSLCSYKAKLLALLMSA